jgi:hypothetical protein
MKKKLLCLIFLTCYSSLLFAQQTSKFYLSGKDKDRTVNWEFFCTSGMKSGKWTTIPVPSQWELKGFGAYNYGHDKVKADEKGLYRYHFKTNKTWKGKAVAIVFEGVMTDAEVKINGQLAGPIHQGGFYQFEYAITKLLKPTGDNLLEVTVSKQSADQSVNNAERKGDFWVLGGIFRPVYLKVMPKTAVQRVSINADADGYFRTDIFTSKTKIGDVLSIQLNTLEGAPFGKAWNFKIKKPEDSTTLTGFFKKPKLWNQEYPNLYIANFSIKRAGQTIHLYKQRFGFRTIEVRKSDGIYVNGTKILIKGVNRHSFWPESGRTLNRKIHLQDIALMKEMNMNAVRMSHYPPDVEFLDLCDSLGMFVLDELTGWQDKYNTTVGQKLVKELVNRDVNHPSILFWDNGNEGGWNTDLDDDYALYDPQRRVVLHPWSNFNNIDTKHYPDYKYVENAEKKQNILLHTEMIHGLYDGGHGAGLEDYWKLIRKNPRHAGGFLWVLSDEGIVRKDKQDSIDTDGNHAPDGILGPHHEKEGSFYTIKEIWSPVQAKAPLFDSDFNGKIELENNYLYTNLSTCKLSWQLVKFPLAKELKTGFTTIVAGKVTASLAPGETGSFKLGLPSNWANADALRFTATDRHGKELYAWVWPIKVPHQISQQNLSAITLPKKDITETLVDNDYTVVQNGISYTFNTQSGYLTNVQNAKGIIAFNNGPALAGQKQPLKNFNHSKTSNGEIVIESNYTGDSELNVKWVFSPGKPLNLKYDYKQTGTADFYGITFNIDESQVTGMRWLGDGPYRSWKNRLKGQNENVWQKKYNNTITGETFDYPEFKGYHSNFYWAEIQAGKSSFKVYTDQANLFLQLLQPAKPKTKFTPYVNPPFPEGNIGFLNAIAPIGNKFGGPETMGPQGEKNQAQSGVISGQLWFQF